MSHYSNAAYIQSIVPIILRINQRLLQYKKSAANLAKFLYQLITRYGVQSDQGRELINQMKKGTTQSLT